MEAWEKAVHKFLTPWKAKKYVIGALVTGSFVTGNATKHSDVDLHIILDGKVKWRERGNKMVDGFLIEYFANPPQQLKKCMEEGYRDGKRVDARMYLLGKIIFDRTGEVKKLQENAKKEFKKKFKKPDKVWTELTKYSIWEALDDLTATKHQKPIQFRYNCNLVLSDLLKKYAKYLGAELVPPAKLHRLFFDKIYRKNSHLHEFPDRTFVNLFVICLKSKMMINCWRKQKN